MFKKAAVIAGLVLFVVSFTASAEETKWLSASLKMEYISQYQWRGWDVSVGDPALWSDLSFGIADTDFYAGIWFNYNTNNRYNYLGWSNWDEIDFYFGHWWGFWSDNRYALEVDAGYTYFYFPQQPRDVDTMEVSLGFTMPKIFTWGETSFGPYTTVYHGWSARNTDVETETMYFWKGADPGTWVKVGLNWNIPIKQHSLDLYVESFHNDGGQGLEATPGWSHIAYGIKGGFTWKQLKLIGSLNYQDTWDSYLEAFNSVDADPDDHEFWYSMGFSYDF